MKLSAGRQGFPNPESLKITPESLKDSSETLNAKQKSLSLIGKTLRTIRKDLSGQINCYYGVGKPRPFFGSPLY
jgi:hypothetical protein